MLNKLIHFYVNKYLVSPFCQQKYYLSYGFKHKILWYRNYKVASRTIDHILREQEGKHGYIYSSQVGYLAKRYQKWFKFAFVRDPEERFVSGWKNLVLDRNYYKFSVEEHEKMKSLDHYIEWAEKFDKESCDEHLRSQYSLIDLENVDFIGKMEEFDRDFSYVAKEVGFEYKPIPKKNVSMSSPQKISQEQKKKIKAMYLKDYQQFYPEKLKEGREK